MRLGNILLGFVLVCLALSPSVWAVDGTNGEAGVAGLDNDTLQLWDSQDPPHILVTPQNTTKTLTGHGTSTLTNTDIGTSTPSASAIPVAGTDSKISTGWIDTGTGASQVIVGSDPRLSDPRTPLQTYSHTVTVSNGKIKPLSAFQHPVCWGTVTIGVTVLFTNPGAAGTRQFLLLSTFGAAGSAWKKMVALETGYGQDDWLLQHNIYVRDAYGGCGIEFGLSAEGGASRTATVIFTDYSWGLGVREDVTYKAEEDVSTAGDFYSRVKLSVNYLGIGVADPTIPLDIASATFAAIKLTATTGTNGAYLNIVNGGGQFWVGRNSSTGDWLINDGSPYSAAIVSGGGYPIELAVNATLKLSVGASVITAKVPIDAPNEIAVSGGHWQTGTNSTTDTVTKTNILDGTATRTLVVSGGGTLYAGDGIGFGTSSTATDTVTGTGTVSCSGTGSGSSTATNTIVTTFTGTATVTITTGSTASSTQTRTTTVTGTSTGTVNATSTGSATITITGTGTGSSTTDGTGTLTGSGTTTATMTGTGTGTGSNTFTVTKTHQKTDTVSGTGTITVTVTLTDTDSATAIITGTATTTGTGTATITSTGSGSWTGTTTSTDTESSAETSTNPTIVNTWHLGYVTYWLKASASDIGGYKVLNTAVAEDDVEANEDYVTISEASGETLVTTWATAVGEPGRVIPAGDWVFNAYPFESCPIGEHYNYLKFKVYRRSYAGTEAELFSVETDAHKSCYNEEPNQLLVTTYAANKITMLASERIVVKVYARTTNLTPLDVGISYDSQYGYTYGDDDDWSYVYGLPGAFSCIETPMTRGFTPAGHRDYARVLSGSGEWIWINPAP